MPLFKDFPYLPARRFLTHNWFLDSCFSVYRVIDVGGQKNQRKKWIHFFEGVTAVVFFASLSSYDEFVEEDENSVSW